MLSLIDRPEKWQQHENWILLVYKQTQIIIINPWIHAYIYAIDIYVNWFYLSYWLINLLWEALFAVLIDTNTKFTFAHFLICVSQSCQSKQEIWEKSKSIPDKMVKSPYCDSKKCWICWKKIEFLVVCHNSDT